MTPTISTTCSPRFQTSPDPTLRTLGADVARTAIVLGQPLTPWQRHAANLFGTLRPDGRFRYRRWVLIVPRRAGKTWLMLCLALTVMRWRAMARAFYAGPRRDTAAAMWRDDWFPFVETSPLHPRYVRLRQSNGSESMVMKHNRSTFRLMPPSGDAMRTFRSNLAMVDEGREFTLEQGEEFERAVFPTQATGFGGAFLIVSNAGTGSAAWLRRWRDLGRASIDNPASEIAMLEYSATEGADISDRAVWWSAHPGLGHHVLIDALEADYEVLPPDDFAAEYLGLWPETQIDAKLVGGWRAGVVDVAELADPVVFGLEVDTDRTRLVIVAAGSAPTARPAVALVADLGLSPAWSTTFADLLAQWRPVAAVYDAGGPVASLAHVLADLPVNVAAVPTREITAGAGAFHDRVTAGTVEHGDDPTLEAAIVAARRRDAGGAWLYDRRTVAALPVLAAANAVWRWSSGSSRPPTVS